MSAHSPFPLAALAVGALLISATAAATAPKSKLLGSYKCAIKQSGINYPAQPCSIAFKPAKDGSGRTLWFAKAAGSQHLSGWVAPKEDGFEVDGQIECPKGSCTEPLQMRFVAVPGGFDGAFELAATGPVTVIMRK